MRKNIHFLFGVGLSMLIVLSLAFVPASATAYSAPDEPGGNSLSGEETVDILQFSSNAHILGFMADGMYAATGSLALHVKFAGTRGAQPAAGAAPVAGNQIPALNQVTYTDLWPGIRLTYAQTPLGVYATTYTLAPGAHPSDIRLIYNAPLALNEDGSLRIAFENGALAESAPIAWQEIQGQRIRVAASFRVHGREVGFLTGAYDPRYPLTIDPTLTWNTFLGGDGIDEGRSIALDGSGNIYVGGESNVKWANPVSGFNGSVDVFVAKLNSNGSLLWNTFLGGSAADNIGGIAVDAKGNILVAGRSDATWGSPVRPFKNLQDAFVAKLNSSGNLTWNTFLGGSDVDSGNAIAVDGSGNVYVAGQSKAKWDNPVRPYTASKDAFAAKLSSGGSLTWTTFLGGNGIDDGAAIAVDGSGNVYVAGQSDVKWGSPVRAFTASEDAFAAKLSSSGSLTWNTFLGGSGSDGGEGIAVDGSGNVYLAGSSSATWGSPVRLYTASEDAFAAELGPSGGLTWNTFLGGTGIDSGHAIALDTSGNVYVAGESRTTWDSPVRAYTANLDGFAAKLSSSGDFAWNTFLGGNLDDQSWGITVDDIASIYVAGTSSATWGAPVRPIHALSDAFVTNLGTFTISGNVGLAQAHLSYSDGVTKVAVADGSGNYSFTVPFNWSGTVTPMKTCYTFSPPDRTYTGVLSDQTDQSYTAAPAPICWRLYLPLVLR